MTNATQNQKRRFNPNKTERNKTMGWDFSHRPSGEKLKDFFEKEFPDVTIVESAVVDEIFYAAVKINQGEREGMTTAVVCLTKRQPNGRCNFGYKAMDETMHPFYYDCPLRVLDKLSPTINESALEWRTRCRLAVA